ncbi:MAG: hypothetical protein F6J98_02255 [Moorea sp. SIO4G2]|nr:hypothetical protein [Moorena sp. SIO4G2]
MAHIPAPGAASAPIPSIATHGGVIFEGLMRSLFDLVENLWTDQPHADSSTWICPNQEISTDSRFFPNPLLPTPYSLLPIPDSRFPIPDSRFPISSTWI